MFATSATRLIFIIVIKAIATALIKAAVAKALIIQEAQELCGDVTIGVVVVLAGTFAETETAKVLADSRTEDASRVVRVSLP